MGQAVLVNRMSADLPNMDRSIFLIILNLNYKIIVGLFYVKKFLQLKIGIADVGLWPSAKF